MLADAEYFSSRISKLDGAGDLGMHIVEIVKNKTIIADPQPQSPSTEKGEIASKDVEKNPSANGEQEKP